MSLRELLAFSTELPAAYRRNDGSRDGVLALQSARAKQLVVAARATTAYRGLAAWRDAPPVDKTSLMARFDEHVVAGAPTGDVARAFLQRGRPGALLDGRWTVTTTSGTTGEVGDFVVEDGVDT